MFTLIPIPERRFTFDEGLTEHHGQDSICFTQYSLDSSHGKHFLSWFYRLNPKHGTKAQRVIQLNINEEWKIK